jgi:hypothetical protein
VLERRLLSPEICRWRRRSCGTLLEISPIVLGFSIGRLFIGEGALLGVDQGGLTTRGAPPHGEAALWPPSDSLSVHVLYPGKIGVSVFGLSNSENISCVAFLKHKTAENRELALWHLVSRLVLEIA